MRQDVVSSAHRAFDARGFGVRTFPGFLAECLRKRVWEQERKLEGGGAQGPVAFEDFITKPYPVGLGASFEEVERIVAGNAELSTEWESLTGRVVGPKMVPLDRICRDGSTQSRQEFSWATIEEYAEHASELPPVVVFDDGETAWLADGFHRCEAFERAGWAEVPCEVRSGGKRDALLYSVGANADHGLRRTNADKRRAVTLLLLDEEWTKRSDRWIAEKCGVGHQLVGTVRAQLDESSSSPAEPRIGQDGKARRLPSAEPLSPRPEPQRELLEMPIEAPVERPDRPAVALRASTEVDAIVRKVRRWPLEDVRELVSRLEHEVLNA